MGSVITYDRNQSCNQSRDGEFRLKDSKSYQPDSSEGGRLWRPDREMREVKTMIKVTHDGRNSYATNFTSIVRLHYQRFQLGSDQKRPTQPDSGIEVP